MLIYSELATPADRVDLEPTASDIPGPVMYHVWERTRENLPTVFGVQRPYREYRGMIKARELAPILFPEGV